MHDIGIHICIYPNIKGISEIVFPERNSRLALGNAEPNRRSDLVRSFINACAIILNREIITKMRKKSEVVRLTQGLEGM